MTLLAITIEAAVFFWVAASFILAGAWCAAFELTSWHQRRRVARRRAARGGFIYDRQKDRLPW